MLHRRGLDDGAGFEVVSGTSSAQSYTRLRQGFQITIVADLMPLSRGAIITLNNQLQAEGVGMTEITR